MPLDVLLLILRIAIALALYVFLGVMLYYIWRDVQSAGISTAERSRNMGRLIVVDPGGLADMQGHTYPLQTITSMGRAPTNTIVLFDRSASSDHALILWRRGQWWLEDQKSRNGTTVNDIRVTEPIVLASGDEISVGRVRFRLELES